MTMTSSMYQYFMDNLKRSGGKIISAKCSVHHCHLIKFPNIKKPICPIGYQQKCNQKMTNKANSIYRYSLEEPKKQLKYADTNFLYNHSIVGDPHIINASFSNFSTRMNKSVSQIKNIRSVKQCEKDLKAFKNKMESEASIFCTNRPDMYFNLIIRGRSGRGKSHLAMAILKYVNRHVKPRVKSSQTNHYPRCMFVDTNELMRLIKDSFNNPKTLSEEHLVKVLSSVYLLVLDDFGAESGDNQNNKIGMSYSERILYEILSNRTRTIFTTNFSRNELEQRYNPKIVSRMLSGALQHIYTVPNSIPDHRRVFESM